MISQLREYQAVSTSREPAVRVSVFAESLEDAKTKLEAEHGAGTVWIVWNEEDAQKPR
jgi:hypothetical protein